MNTIYLASDGRYYTERDRRRNFESGEWAPCLRFVETGVQTVVTRDDVMLRLDPICGGPVARSSEFTYEYRL